MTPMPLIYLISSRIRNNIGLQDPGIRRVSFSDPGIWRVYSPDPLIWRVCSPDAIIWTLRLPTVLIWTLRLPDVLIWRVQDLRVAVVIGESDSVSPETLELAILTQRVGVRVPGGVARYDPQVIHRWVKILIRSEEHTSELQSQ